MTLLRQNGKALSCGPTERYARASPGTTVMVKDLYHSVSQVGHGGTHNH